MFTVNGHTSGFGVSLPQDMDPGLKPNTSDTVLVRLSSCSSHQTPVVITAKDSLNHTYTFVLQPS
jgi:hypothetical protein